MCISVERTASAMLFERNDAFVVEAFRRFGFRRDIYRRCELGDGHYEYGVLLDTGPVVDGG